MAVDYPLVLYDCSFEGLSWQRDGDEVNHVLSTLQQHWTQSAVRSHVLHAMIQGLEAVGGYLKGQLPSKKNKIHCVNGVSGQVFCRSFDLLFSTNSILIEHSNKKSL